MTTATWRIQDKEAVRVDATDSMHAAKYDLTGTVRIWTGTDRLVAPTADELVVWDAEAPVRAAELVTKRAAQKNEESALVDTIRAKFRGRCAITGQTINRGERIRMTSSGWALASAAGSAIVSPLGAEFDADERDAYRDDIRTAVAELAMG